MDNVQLGVAAEMLGASGTGTEMVQEQHEPTRHRQHRVMRVCRPDELEELTRNGWRFVEALPVDEMTSVYENFTASEQALLRQHSGGYGVESGRSRHIPIRTVKILVSQDASSAIAQANARAATAEREASDARRQIAEALAKIKTLEADLRKAQENIAYEKRESDKALSDLRAEQALRRKMELDIGKIRKDIGEARMREILGEAKS